jgi:hypothetical protein
MGVIYIDYLQPGMLLNTDVKDQTGRLLLNAGAEITEQHLRIFRTWGITEADIQGVTKEDVGTIDTVQIDPVILQKIESKLNKIFSHTDREHTFINELFRLCISRKTRQIIGGVISDK